MGAGGQRPNGAATQGVVGRALTGRVAALAFLALSVLLAIALFASLVGWQRERADLQRSISDLQEQSASAQLKWKAQLAACNAAASPQRAIRTGSASGDDAAQQLLAEGPEGIDVCARMESADRAVLSTLK